MLDPLPADSTLSANPLDHRLLCFVADHCLTLVLQGQEFTLDDSAVARVFSLLADYVKQGSDESLLLSIGGQQLVLCRDDLVLLHGHLDQLIGEALEAWSDGHRVH
jgi:hypothetical protein